MTSISKLNSEQEVSRAGQMFSAFKYPNYRLWFIGQLISMVGTWMQSTAQGFLVYELTHSVYLLGVVGFVGGLPSWIFSLFAGAVADRLPRRTMLVITQTVMMMLAFILATLTYFKVVQPWHIIVLAFFLGTANSFDAPARQAFVREMVERDTMTNAIALNSAMFNMAVITGPAVGGLAYSAFGPFWCFFLNGVSFIAIIINLLLMKIKPMGIKIQQSDVWTDVAEGLRYTTSHPIIRMLIINLGVFTILGMGVLTLLPAWSVEILKGNAATNGWLLSARGVGSLFGSLMIAWLGQAGFRGKLWTAASLLMPIILFGFAFMRWLPLSLVGMAIIGWSFMSVANTTNALVQSQVEDRFRGRVMGIYTLIFFGAFPLGALIAGSLAQRIGEPPTVMISAAALLVFSLYVYLRLPAVRALN